MRSNMHQIVSACHYPPVATSSLVTYEICKELHEDIASECGVLCAIGTHGDLGTSLKWLPPFPDMTVTFKTYTKKLISDCVSLLNARKFQTPYNAIHDSHVKLAALENMMWYQRGKPC